MRLEDLEGVEDVEVNWNHKRKDQGKTLCALEKS